MALIQKKYIVSIALFALFLFIPAFLFQAEGSDLQCQSLWVKNFSHQFWNGNLYPRWLMDMYAGNGSPVFFYYPPFAYYISALFYPVLPHDYFGFLPMAASALVATFVSGMAFFIWVREETSDDGALLGSLLYMAIPWHIGFNFYNALLYSTTWAYAWLPLMLLSARFLVQGKSYGICAFSVSLCLMVMTNIPATIICGPLAVLYGAYYCDKKNMYPVIVKGTAAIVLGFGLAAVFLLPSLVYMKYVMVSLHWYNEHLYFFRFSLSNTAQMTCNLFWLLDAAIIVSYYMMTRETPSRLRSFFLLLSVLVLFMTSGLSQWIWENVFILQVLQEPARLFMVTNLIVGVLAAAAGKKYKAATIIYIICAVLMVFQIAINAQVSRQSFARVKPVEYERYTLGIDQYISYLGYPDLVNKYYKDDSIQKLKEHSEHAYVTEGDATFNIIRWKPRDIEFTYTATTPSALLVHQSFFPGWQAFVNGQPLYTSWDQESGQVAVKLPPGAGTVELQLTALWPESLGRLISLLSAGIIFVIFLIGIKSDKALLKKDYSIKKTQKQRSYK